MTKIEEMIDQMSKKTPDGILYPYMVKMLMEKYAEYYAQKCLEIAANRAEIIYLNSNPFILTDSITGIELSKHD